MDLDDEERICFEDDFADWLNEEEVYFQAWSSFLKDFLQPKHVEIKKEEEPDDFQATISSICDLFEQDDEEMTSLFFRAGNGKSAIKKEIKSELPEIKFDIESVLKMDDKFPGKNSRYLESILGTSDDENTTNETATSEGVFPKTASKRKASETKAKKPRAPRKRARRDIFPILLNGRLNKSTRDAKKAEKSKRSRLEKRQVEEEELALLHPDKVILDFDNDTKEILAEIEPKFVPLLKKHQIDGVKFLFNSLVESVDLVENESKDKSAHSHGGILAHCMGLGKTFQVVAFIQSVLTNPRLKDKLKRVLLILPLNVMKNWESEFNSWYQSCKLKRTFNLYELHSSSNPSHRVARLEKWHREGGVLLMTPKLFCQLLIHESYVESVREAFMACLLNPGPDMVIVDEGHCLKNMKSDLNQTTSQIRTLRRVILTGTPMQNNLSEYYTMVNFVKPYLLGSKEEFDNQFANPITNGQYSDSTEGDVLLMKHRFFILHKLLESSTIHRRSYAILEPDLPRRYEYVLDCRLTPVQKQMYDYYIENYVFGDILGEFSEKKNLFLHFSNLGFIWNHPAILLSYFAQSKEKILKAKIKKEEPESDEEGEVKVTKTTLKSVETIISTWDPNHLPKLEDLYELELSAKFSLLFGILSECEKIGDKILVFSQSLLTLNMIEGFLKRDRVMQQNCRSKWTKGEDYFRIDGSVCSDDRNRIVELFNDPSNKRGRLILISTRAGGVGINLVGANRAVIFDSSWNPANDMQAIYRIYRYGQKKQVFIYRFAAYGTMESKIYKRQIQKQSVSLRVVDQYQIERHFKDKVLRELYELIEDEKRDPPVPPEEDQVLWKVFARYQNLEQHPVVGYHEHDSLLENLPGEKLSNEEEHQVWKEYLAAVEAASNPPPPPPPPAPAPVPGPSSQFSSNGHSAPSSGLLAITNGPSSSQASDFNNNQGHYSGALDLSSHKLIDTSSVQPLNGNIFNFENYSASTELADDDQMNDQYSAYNSNLAIEYPQHSIAPQNSDNPQDFSAFYSNNNFPEKSTAIANSAPALPLPDAFNDQNVNPNSYFDASPLAMMNFEEDTSLLEQDMINHYFKDVSQIVEEESCSSDFIKPYNESYGTVGSDFTAEEA